MDYKELLIKYMLHVLEEESSTYLTSLYAKDYITKEEANELILLDKTVEEKYYK